MRRVTVGASRPTERGGRSALAHFGVRTVGLGSLAGPPAPSNRAIPVRRFPTDRARAASPALRRRPPQCAPGRGVAPSIVSSRTVRASRPRSSERRWRACSKRFAGCLPASSAARSAQPSRTSPPARIRIAAAVRSGDARLSVRAAPGRDRSCLLTARAPPPARARRSSWRSPPRSRPTRFPGSPPPQSCRGSWRRWPR